MTMKAVFRWLTSYSPNSTRTRRQNLTTKFRSAATEGHLVYVDMPNKINEKIITVSPDEKIRPHCHRWDGVTQRLQAQRMIKTNVKETLRWRKIFDKVMVSVLDSLQPVVLVTIYAVRSS